MKTGMEIQEIAYHRNGVGGEGFHVVRFKDKEAKQAFEGATEQMVAIVFEGSGQVAVLNVDLLKRGVIAFTENSWRGDKYEPYLRSVIRKHDEDEYARLKAKHTGVYRRSVSVTDGG
jgi:hypothetical protein